MNKPFLCKLGLHKQYKYLPKVGGDLGEISIACSRCGFGLRYFTGKWDIQPKEVQDSVNKQAEIEYGRVLGFFRGLDPLQAMQSAYDCIKDKFTEAELLPIKQNLDKMAEYDSRR